VWFWALIFLEVVTFLIIEFTPAKNRIAAWLGISEQWLQRISPFLFAAIIGVTIVGHHKDEAEIEAVREQVQSIQTGIKHLRAAVSARTRLNEPPPEEVSEGATASDPNAGRTSPITLVLGEGDDAQEIPLSGGGVVKMDGDQSVGTSLTMSYGARTRPDNALLGMQLEDFERTRKIIVRVLNRSTRGIHPGQTMTVEALELKFLVNRDVGYALELTEPLTVPFSNYVTLDLSQGKMAQARASSE